MTPVTLYRFAREFTKAGSAARVARALVWDMRPGLDQIQAYWRSKWTVTVPDLPAPLAAIKAREGMAVLR